MKTEGKKFKILLALILVFSILMIPMDTLALINGATPDEAAPAASDTTVAVESDKDELSPVGAGGVAEVNGTEYATLSEALGAWSAGSTLKLMTDVTTGSTITVPSGEHTLDLNGHGIKMTGSGAVIKVGSGSTLNMNDSDTGATHKFDVPDGAGLAVLNEASGTYTVNGGYITGGNETLAGGVYILDNGTFNMYGGCIIGNKANLHGGGVDVSAPGTKTAIFNMYGGSICYNSSTWGGGINVFGTAYVNEGCTIHHNTASNGGGGIELESGGKLYLNGSTVTENVVLSQNGGMWKGGGVHVPNGTECHLQGAVQIKDNYRETFGTSQSNMFVRREVPGKVILDSALSSNSSIGVGTNGDIPFTVTSAYGTYHGTTDPSKYFTSDYSDYIVSLNNNSEVEVINKPVATVTSGGSTTYYSDLASALNAWTEGSTLKLFSDVTTSSTITVPTGEHTLDLNGYGVTITGSGSVFTIGSGATLNLNDSGNTVHYFDVDSSYGYAKNINTSGGGESFTGGYITGGYALTGGGININGGTLNMDGGSVIGNRADNNGNKGGGICISNNGKVTLSSGSISYNYAQNAGGGVALRDGDFTMTGGEISHNRVSHAGGAGMAFHYTGTFTMTGGSIINNHAGWTGGGIDCYSANEGDARIIISGSPVIKDNLADNNGSSIDSVNNVMLRGNIRVTIDGKLTDEAAIGILLQNGTGEFTSGWSTYMGNADPSGFFTSDNSDYAVMLNENGEVEINIPAASVVHADQSATPYKTLQVAINAAANGETVQLLNDVPVTSTLTITKNITFDLNGYGLISSGVSVFYAESKTWTLMDSSPNRSTHYYTIDENGLAHVSDDPDGADGSFTGGYLTGTNESSTYTSCIYVWKTNTTMTGGTVIGNQKINNLGGAVYIRDSGTFTLQGGAFIYNRTTDSGGAFGINGGTLNIQGGVISHNRAANNGGAIATWSNYSNVVVNISGGAITDNCAGSLGGGVCFTKPARNKNTTRATISGGVIAGNIANNGGGISVDGRTATQTLVTMTGGAIEYNEGSGNTGGVLLLGGTTFTMTGGAIRHNAGFNFGGIGTSNATLAFSGTIDISDNYIYSDGTSGKITKSGDSYTLDTTGGLPANIKTANANDRIRITAPLTSSQKIGVIRSGNTGVFTTGWSTNMSDAEPADYFMSDSEDYIVIKNGDGEAELIARPDAIVTSGDSTDYCYDLSSALSAWTAGSTLKLMNDITTDITITVPSGEHTLDLNGYGILMTGNDRVVTINQGASLELNDSDPDRIHYITLTDYRGTAVSSSGEESVSNGNGVIKVTGGYLTGGYRNNSGSHDRCGAGVYNWGTFVMNGGSIVGNTMHNNSGGAIRNSGYFTMNGGTIAFNYASGNGGGVTTYVPGGSQGKMTMNGGEISDNYCGSYGGGIQIAGPIEMTGGSVVRNTAGAGGSGVFYDGKNDRFKLSGDPVIKDNSNNDDLYLGANATFMINDSLTEGADIHVLMNTPAEFTVGWKDIMGNDEPSKYFTSANSGYAVILNNNGEAAIALPPVASIISGETATDYGYISEAVNAWTAGSTLKLLEDVTTTSTITVPAGAHTLDLNGYNLEAGSTGYSVITVGSGAELTIDDTSENVGKITGGSVGQNYGGGVTVDGGALMLKGGAISGNANTHGGIGNCGGGVHVRNGGKFYMEGGEISGNTSYVGGGVCSDASATTVSITGGVIKNNKTERFGSAIWAGRNSSAIFRIGGDAQIIDNISTWTADKDGEASVNFVGALLLSGNPTVHGDWKANGTSSPNTHINLDNDGSGVQRLTLEGALTNDTGSPSITMSPIYRWNDLANGQTFVFTKNWNQYMGTAHPADYFKVDSGVSGVTVIRKDGEAAFTGSGDLGDLYITFDANEGEGEMDPQLATVTNVTLNENTFTRKDYSFAGWNTKKDGSGTGYSDKATVTLTGDLTLYAQWKEPVASIISGETATDYGYISEAVNAWTAGSTLKLLEDVTTTSTITVPAGAHTLDLNGFTITRTGATGADNSGLVMTVNNGVDLTVTGPGKITGGSGFHGGGIHVEGNSSLVLDNCEISGNTGHYGGGLYLSVGTITLKNGAAVKNNTATEGFGGSGIYAEGGGTLILEDATFTENAIRNGNQHAVFLAGNANIKVSGAPVIYDNTYNGEQKNLYLYQAADQHSYVMPAGALTDGAKIGVGQTTGAGVFTVGWPTYMSDPDSAAYFISSVANYDVLMNQDGELEIAYPLVPDVSAEGFAGDYDGAAHSITVSAPEGAEVKYGLQEGSFTLTENPAFTDAGTYTVYYEVSVVKHTSVYGSAIVRIDPIDVTVTVTGHNSTVNYDGESHTVIGYDVAFSTTLYTEDAFTFTGEAKVERTNAGTATMGLTAGQFANVSDNFAHVTFNVTDGYVTVNPINVTVSIIGHTGSAEYDGSAHSVIGYDVAFSTPLYTEADFTFSGTATAERTDAGTTAMGLEERQFENKSPNFAVVTFDIKDGSITVDPTDVTVTVTGHSSTVDYDGEAHSVSGYDAVAESDLYDVTKDFTFTGTAQATQTDAGTAAMQLRAEQFSNTNPNFSTVTFIITDGYITVDPIDVTVTIVGDSVTVDYDGNTHFAFEYTATADTELYDVEEDFTFISTAYADRADAGVTYMGMKPEHFENTNNNFADVTFIVTDGYVRIDPIDVTVTITGSSDTAVYDGTAHAVSGYEATADSDLYDVTKDFTFTGTAHAEQTDAGTASMGLKPEQFGNLNPNFADVTFTVTDGYQTITRADAVITTAPRAKDKLVYTGSEQQLIMPGSVTGGTLYYALGADGSTAPAESDYSTQIPTASQVGNYYIWYKVIADANHNSIAPASMKITLAEPEWMTIKGEITFGDGSAAADDVTVTLMSGNTVVDTIDTDANGGYYFTVPAGIYNIVVTSGDITQTVMVDITEGTVRDITLSEGNTKSVLDVVSSDKSIVVGGLDKEAASVRSSEGLSYDRSVTVKMTVATVSAGATTASAAISDYAQDRYLEYYDMKVEKTVDSVTTTLSETQNVLEVAIPFSYTAKRELAVYRCDGRDVQELTESSTGAADTYRIDYEAGLVYIYSNRVQTYAISYKPYYRVNSLLALGSFGGSVSVKLTKDTTGVTYELNNVSLQNISFTGVPKGTYTMTVTWKDGAENTLTLPFVIK